MNSKSHNDNDVFFEPPPPCNPDYISAATGTNDINNRGFNQGQESSIPENTKGQSTNWKYIRKSLRFTANRVKESTVEAYNAAKDFEEKNELIPKGKKLAESTYESAINAASSVVSKKK